MGHRTIDARLTPSTYAETPNAVNFYINAAGILEQMRSPVAEYFYNQAEQSALSGGPVHEQDFGIFYHAMNQIEKGFVMPSSEISLKAPLPPAQSAT